MAPNRVQKFAGQIIIEERDDSITYAGRACELHDEDGSLSFFTDGSGGNIVLGKGSSAAVVYRRRTTDRVWTEIAYPTPQITDSNDAEIFGIMKALEIGRTISEGDPAISKVVVFTDSRSFLDGISRLKLSRSVDMDLVRQVFSLGRALVDSGKVLELRWVKGHSSVEGNMRADRVAKQCRPLVEKRAVIRKFKKKAARSAAAVIEKGRQMVRSAHHAVPILTGWGSEDSEEESSSSIMEVEETIEGWEADTEMRDVISISSSSTGAEETIAGRKADTKMRKVRSAAPSPEPRV